VLASLAFSKKRQLNAEKVTRLTPPSVTGPCFFFAPHHSWKLHLKELSGEEGNKRFLPGFFLLLLA
jgi:hypothetical protein